VDYEQDCSHTNWMLRVACLAIFSAVAFLDLAETSRMVNWLLVIKTTRKFLPLTVLSDGNWDDKWGLTWHMKFLAWLLVLLPTLLLTSWHA